MKNDVYVLQKNLFGAKIGDEVHFVGGFIYHLKLNDTESLTLKASIVENNPDYFVLKDESTNYKEIDLYHCFMNRHKYKDSEFKKYLNSRHSKGNEYETKNGLSLDLICNENDWEIQAFVTLSNGIGEKKEYDKDNNVIVVSKREKQFIKKEDGFYYDVENRLSYEYLLSDSAFYIFSVKRVSDNKMFCIVQNSQTEHYYRFYYHKAMFIKLIDGKIYQEKKK